MGRHAGGGRATCEGCKSLDIRRLHQEKLLRPGQACSWSWSRDGQLTGSIDIKIRFGEITLRYRTRRHDGVWQDISETLPITWTPCALGGQRPWFICPVYARGRYCGRRVALLYAAGDLFACRHCYGLAYASQSQSPRDRHLSQAQKVRRALGGSASICDPFPNKPPRMHWRTYHRLHARANSHEQRSLALIGGMAEPSQGNA